MKAKRSQKHVMNRDPFYGQHSIRLMRTSFYSNILDHHVSLIELELFGVGKGCSPTWYQSGSVDQILPTSKSFHYDRDYNDLHERTSFHYDRDYNNLHERTNYLSNLWHLSSYFDSHVSLNQIRDAPKVLSLIYLREIYLAHQSISYITYLNTSATFYAGTLW